MRTTLTIDDRIAQALKEAAHRSGKSFKEVVNETLRKGLTAQASPGPAPYRLKPVDMGKPLRGYDLTKALALADSLEDEELLRKMEQRK